MKCPACRVPMYVVEYEQVELDLCPDCGGVWFDHGELELLLSRGAAIPLADAGTSEQGRSCPLCDKTMLKKNIGPAGRVLVDVCPRDCGLWFDRAEVQDLGRDLQDAAVDVDPGLGDFLNWVFPRKGGQ